jgi:hypothetical protein
MSTMIKTTLAFGAVALALVACGKKDDGAGGTSATGTAALTGAAKTPGACNKLSIVGKCSEYDMSKDSLGLNKAGCEATDGKWQTSACPTEKSFANCATSESKIFYYAGTTAPGAALTMDEEFAKLDCEMMSGKLTVTGKATVAEAPKPAANAANGANGANGANTKKPAAAAPAPAAKAKK